MNILQKLSGFVSSVILTGQGNLKYKVPAEAKTETVVLFGFTITLTESFADGVLELDAKRS